MRALVIGGTGPSGHFVVNGLRARGYRVSILHTGRHEVPEIPDDVEHVHANPYVPDELAFEFHYFFTRKYWFLYLVKAMVLMPGGFGTMDELFETLTLRQTGKIKKPVPTVLFGSDYWDSIFNLDAMVEWGTIAQKDLLMFHRSDTVDDAFDYLVDAIETLERTELG